MTRNDLFSAEHPIWDSIECQPRAEREALQLARLRGLVERVAEVPFYKRAFAAADITPGSFQSDLVARLLVAGGLRPEHWVHIAFGYGLFTGGFGLHQGIERIGAAIVPAASGNTRRQIKLIQDLETEVLVCTPSYALTIADTAREQGLDPRKLPLRFAHLGGEPWTEDMRHAIEAELEIQAYNNYGLSEIIGPGVNGECHCRTGMHIQEDHERPGTLDKVRVKVEMHPETFASEDQQQQLIRRIMQEIQTVVGIRTEVVLVEPRSLERFAGKAKRVIDRRSD